MRLVDKTRAMPAEYVPPDLVTLEPIDSSPRPAITLKLRREAADAMHRMLAQARGASMFIVAISAYRDYIYQEQVFQEEVRLYGQRQAERESALAGHSEHQLGTAIDFSTRQFAYNTEDAFGTSAEGRWLQQHAMEFGFVLSYPLDKEAVTGYIYEPWHYRFIGVNNAQTLQKSGGTLEEWLLAHPTECSG
jgi:D-alanyl-D-alanine carboxypeptidase